MKKKILMGTCNYWKSPFQVGSHNIAKIFKKKGWDVFFLSDSISFLHLLGGITNELKERYASHKKGIEIDNEIKNYIPYSLITPHNKILLNTKIVQDNWYKLTIPNVAKIIKEAGFEEVDLLYLDSISQYYLLDTVKYKKSIFRVADKNSGFDKYTKISSIYENLIASRVDAVVYTANTLEDYVDSLYPKSKLLFKNGVNFSHFCNSDKIKPEEYKNINTPIILYVGAIEGWFDFEMIRYVANSLSGYTFVLIGNDKIAKTKLSDIKNIRILGTRNYDILPSYMYFADCGIIPFDKKNYASLVNSINPLKLYEYMACGLPVVSVKWDELEKLNSPAILYTNKEDFIDSLISVVENKDSDKAKLVDFARKYDWDQKIDNLIDYLGV